MVSLTFKNEALFKIAERIKSVEKTIEKNKNIEPIKFKDKHSKIKVKIKNRKVKSLKALKFLNLFLFAKRVKEGVK